MNKEAIKTVLEALNSCTITTAGCKYFDLNKVDDAIEVIEEALAKQEPVAYDVRCDNCGGDGYDPKDNNYFCSSCKGSGFLEKMFYTTPPQRKPLTEDEILKLRDQAAKAWQEANYSPPLFIFDARAIEAAHGIKE